MIRKLRRNHGLLFIPLAIIVFLILIVSPSEIKFPVNEFLPGLSKSTEAVYLVESAQVNWDKSEALSSSIYRSENGQLVLQIYTYDYLNYPDMLVYLNRVGGSSLNSDSWLLGSFQQNESQQLVIPDSSLVNGSSFILYSLPKKEVVSVGELDLSEEGE